MTGRVSSMGRSRLVVDEGQVIHPSSRQHKQRSSPAAPPKFNATRPTKISKDNKVLPALKLYDLTPEQQQRVKDLLAVSSSEAYSGDEGAGSLADLLGHGVDGALGFVAQLAAEGNDEAAALLDSWEASYSPEDASTGFWEYFETDPEYR